MTMDADSFANNRHITIEDLMKARDNALRAVVRLANENADEQVEDVGRYGEMASGLLTAMCHVVDTLSAEIERLKTADTEAADQEEFRSRLDNFDEFEH